MLILPTQQFKKTLIKEGIIQEPEFDSLFKEAYRKRQNIINLLVSKGYITEDYYYDFLSRLLKIERIRLKGLKIDLKLLKLLPQNLARSYQAIIFGKQNNVLEVALENPADLETLDFLERYLKKEIKPYLASDSDLLWAFSLYEAEMAKDFQEIIKESVELSLKVRRDKKELKEEALELPVVAVVDNLISYANSLRASDIHLEIMEQDLLARFRIDGILHEIIRISKQIHSALVARIKLLSGLRIDEHAKPQDGRFRYKCGQDVLDLRVSVIPTFYGEKVVMRLLLASQKPFSLEELGVSEDMIKTVSENIKKSYGMILVCGPTGCGKTTTLYSVLDILNRPEVNIVTIEDPVEYDISYVNQIQVNPAAGITFAKGLRSILRQDPDIIMVGEIRDQETAEIAVHSALTGHLVLSSLHTNDAPTTIPRLIDLKIPAFLVAAVLNLVIAQRLVRTIHKDCVQSYSLDEATKKVIKKQLEEIGLDPKEIFLPKFFYKGKGCQACNFTGYAGRIAIFEIIEINEEMRELIISPSFSLDNLKKLAQNQGMRTMFEDGLLKIEKGITTIEEMMRVIKE